MDTTRTTGKVDAVPPQPDTKGQRIEAMQALAHIFASMFETTVATETTTA